MMLRSISSACGRFVHTPASASCATPLVNIADQLNSPIFAGEFAAWSADVDVLDGRQCTRGAPCPIEDYYELPDRDELLRAKWFAQCADARCHLRVRNMGLVRPEYEWAWFINGFNCEEHVEVLVEDLTTEPRRLRRFGLSATTMGEFTGGSIMEDVLIFLHTDLRGGYFEPFTRGFDWKRYLITPPSSS